MNLFAFPLLNIPSGGPENFTLTSVLGFIGNVINVALLFAGAIALIYIIFGGYQYVMAFGNPEKAQTAKQTLVWAIVGLLVSLAAVSIIYFIWGQFVPEPLPNLPK